MPATTTIPGAAEALARLAVARDEAAWTFLVQELGADIRRVAGRLSDDAATADDAAQEALLTLRDRAGSFRPRQDPDGDARRWILRVAANAALELRRSRRRAQARDARGASPAEVDEAASAVVEREETARLVRDALARLGEPERTAIVLRVVEGLGYDQIAAELRCAEGTAKSRVSRGLERLRERLGRREAVASIAALLAQPRCEGALPMSAHALIHSPQAAQVAAVPTILGGLSMAAKLGIALAAILAAATPVALRAQNQEPPKPTTQPPVVVAPVAAPAPADPLQAALDRPVTFDFADQSLTDVLAYLQQVTTIPFAITPGLRASPGSVTLKVKDMKTGDALKWIGQLCDVHLNRADGFMVCSAGAEPILPKFEGVPAAVAAQLAKETTCDFQETAVADAAAFLQRTYAINIVIDPQLVANATPVSLAAQRLPLRSVLQMISVSAGISVAWRDGALFLAPAPKG